MRLAIPLLTIHVNCQSLNSLQSIDEDLETHDKPFYQQERAKRNDNSYELLEQQLTLERESVSKQRVDCC